MNVRTLIASVILAIALPVSAVAADSATASRPCDFDKAKILLVGASGMIGSRILSEATSRGHCVIGAARRPERIATGPNVLAQQLDAADREALTALARRAEVIVLSTSPRSGGDPMQEARAVGESAIAAARATGTRLIVVGGAGSLNLPDGTPFVETLPAAYRSEALAMKHVLELLRASDVNWTFFSPAERIAPGARTGRYRLGTTTLLRDENGISRISAEDYVNELVSEIE